MLLKELRLVEEGLAILFEGNTGLMKWTKSEKMAEHFDVRYYFARDDVSNGSLKVIHCRF